MPADRWNRTEALFEQAADLPPEARDGFLDEACVGPDGAPDPALREEVRALLAADPEAEDYLGLLNADLVGPALELALARLRRSNIVRLADGGVTEDSRAWLAVEYASGEPITDHCVLSFGNVQAKQGEDGEAARNADRVLTPSVGEDPPVTQAPRAFLGTLLARHGQYADAEPYLRGSYETLRECYGAEHPATQDALEVLVDLYEQWGRPKAAARCRAASRRSPSG